MDRRGFLACLVGVLTVLAWPGAPRARSRYFTWAQLRYPGVWDPNPKSSERFLRILAMRTSVEPAPKRLVLDMGDEKLYELPFLYVAGRSSLPRFDDRTVGWLRAYVENGGFILFDDCSGRVDSNFAERVGELTEKLFPGRGLKPLPADHTVFQSFYMIKSVPGRRISRPFLTGVEIEDLTVVMLSHNDLGGAWEGDELGGFAYECVPGGERQREMSFRMGINVVMYALTGNYKKDQVHIPFIMKRRRRL